MDTQETPPCRKRSGKEVSFDFKLSVIAEISNGLISLNYASKKYNISRSTIHYWMKKLSTLNQQSKSHSKNDEIAKLKSRIEELECIKDLQQEIIIEFEKVTSNDLSKKYLPEHLANEIATRKRKVTK
jgi:transposase-like protein